MNVRRTTVVPNQTATASIAADDSMREPGIGSEWATPTARRRFLLLWIVAVFATALALVVHIAMRFETVRLGYEVSDARRAERRLLEQRRLLATEAAALKAAPRIEALARESDLEVPPAERVISIGNGARRERGTGRAR